MSDIDPILLAVLNGRLVQIADEMDATLVSLGVQSDHRRGPRRLPRPLPRTNRRYAGAGYDWLADLCRRDGLRGEGRDRQGQRGRQSGGWRHLSFNDPYDGGTHLNDFRLVRPLFWNGKLFAWLASVGHWLDVGGNVPGNFNAKATESFQEGFRVPPVKLARAGVIQQDIIDILAANSRVPKSNWGDLNGQLNALDLGERRVQALLEDYGEEPVASALDLLTARAEKLMRANIANLPDGTYSYDDFLDNDGITDVPLSIALDLVISGDTMRLDFSRSSPPCDGPLNIALSTTVACCYVALQAHLHRRAGQCRLPGADRIRDSRTPRCSPSRRRGRSAATPRRSCASSTRCSARLPKSPRNAPTASPFATINALSLSGWREHGRRWVMFCFFGGGLGGNPETDGLNHGNNPISTATIPPAEILESLYPVMFTQWALRPDSGGPGFSRGGLGAIYEIEALADGATDVSLLGERGKFPPFGVNGGRSAALNRFVYQTDSGERTPPLVSKVTDIRIVAGQHVRLETPGGGGFGDPMTRDPVRVGRDVNLGYVTKAAARNEYGVVIGENGAVDTAATAALRSGAGQ